MGVYMASRTIHADKWKALRAAGNRITSSWIDTVIDGGNGGGYEELWVRCIMDVSASKAVIVYVEPGEMLNGALVEVGAALSMKKPVFAVGVNSKQHGTWIHHYLVTLCQDVQEALELTRNL